MRDLLIVRAEDDDPFVMPGVHKAEAVSTLEHPLPLCWVADGKQRGATDDEWAISVDHGALPSYAVTDREDLVDCRDCREWMHA